MVLAAIYTLNFTTLENNELAVALGLLKGV